MLRDLPNLGRCPGTCSYRNERAHEKHAAVLLGLQQIKIFQRPLPAVTRVYLQLHERQLSETKGALARAAAR